MAHDLSTLLDLVAAFEQYGERPAVLAMRDEDIDQWSYARLADDCRRLAAGLRAGGLAPGDRGALLAPNRPEWIVACFALIQAGAIPVLIDAQVGEETLDRLLDDSGASWVFATSDLAHRLSQRRGEQEKKIVLLDASEEDARSYRRFYSEEPISSDQIQADDTAVLFYTSGTSGAAKGVPLSHGNLASNLQAIRELGVLKSDDRVLLPLPLHHVYPFTVGMLVPLASGASIIFPRSLSGPQIVRAMTQARANFLLGVPRIYSALTSAIEDRVAARGHVAAVFFRTALAISTMLRRRTGLRIGRGLFATLHRQMAPNLDTVVSGGAPIDPGLARKLEGLGWRFMNGYGLTETSPVLAFNEPGRARIGTVGRPLSGVEVRIAEPESEHPHGEILARGPNVFSGYWNLPDKTDEVFTPDGFFRTGDLGEFDEDGYLRVLGRASSLITLPGGENVRPEDVEEALGQSEVIDEAGVLLHADKLVAVIVPERESIGRADGEELDTRIRREVSTVSRRLPTHHRISDLVVSREPLVRTRLGKIRRHLLAQRYQEIRQGDDTARRPSGPVAVEEMSPEMQALFEIPVTRQTWDWLTERFPDARLSPETELQSELGVDSLDWLRLGLEIQRRTGRQLNEEAMRRIDTVGDLLREITEAEQGVSADAGDVVDRLRTPEDLIDQNQRRWLRPRGFLIRAFGSALFGIDRLALRALLGLQVDGRENLEGDRPVLLVPNHRSYLDAPALAAALPKKRLRQTQWGGATSVMFRNWSRRLVSRATGVVPVEPQREPETSLALAAAVLQNDRSLVWFPEGAISRDGRLQPFQPGIALLIAAQPVPVVPVWIEGTQRALPFGSWRLRSCKIAVHFGKRILPEDMPEGDQSEEGRAERIAQFLHDRVAELEPADA